MTSKDKVRVSILNLIPLITNKTKNVVVAERVSPRKALTITRSSCSEKSANLKEWSKTIKQHCVIPPGHPYSRFLIEKNVPKNDPLWTLGSIAYGTETHWVIIREIAWSDGKTFFPDKWDRDWTLKQAGRLKL
jgi:hypothetical protein